MKPGPIQGLVRWVREWLDPLAERLGLPGHPVPKGDRDRYVEGSSPSAPKGDDAASLGKSAERFAPPTISEAGGPQASQPPPDVILPDSMLVTELPQFPSERDPLMKEFYSFVLSALRGGTTEVAAIEWLAGESLALSGMARAILDHRDLLAELLVTKGADKFGRLVDDLYHREMSRIVDESKKGGDWHLPVQRRLLEVSEGPLALISLIFEEGLGKTEAPGVRELRHDVIKGHRHTLTLLSEVGPELLLKLASSEVAGFDQINQGPPVGAVIFEISEEEARVQFRLEVGFQLVNAIFPHLIAGEGAGIAVPIADLEGLYFSEGADVEKVKSVFRNLVANAVKYHREKGGDDRYVLVKWDRARGAFLVEDNGTGIADVNKVWEEGYRETDRHPGVEGEGLGLAIVKGAIESLGWRIEVESEVGKGSRFFIYPKAGDIVDPPDASPSPAGRSGPAAPGGIGAPSNASSALGPSTGGKNARLAWEYRHNSYTDMPEILFTSDDDTLAAVLSRLAVVNGLPGHFTAEDCLRLIRDKKWGLEYNYFWNKSGFFVRHNEETEMNEIIYTIMRGQYPGSSRLAITPDEVVRPDKLLGTWKKALDNFLQDHGDIEVVEDASGQTVDDTITLLREFIPVKDRLPPEIRELVPVDDQYLDLIESFGDVLTGDELNSIFPDGDKVPAKINQWIGSLEKLDLHPRDLQGVHDIGTFLEYQGDAVDTRKYTAKKVSSLLHLQLELLDREGTKEKIEKLVKEREHVWEDRKIVIPVLMARAKLALKFADEIDPYILHGIYQELDHLFSILGDNYRTSFDSSSNLKSLRGENPDPKPAYGALKDDAWFKKSWDLFCKRKGLNPDDLKTQLKFLFFLEYAVGVTFGARNQEKPYSPAWSSLGWIVLREDHFRDRIDIDGEKLRLDGEEYGDHQLAHDIVVIISKDLIIPSLTSGSNGSPSLTGSAKVDAESVVADPAVTSDIVSAVEGDDPETFKAMLARLKAPREQVPQRMVQFFDAVDTVYADTLTELEAKIEKNDIDGVKLIASKWDVRNWRLFKAVESVKQGIVDAGYSGVFAKSIDSWVQPAKGMSTILSIICEGFELKDTSFDAGGWLGILRKEKWNDISGGRGYHVGRSRRELVTRLFNTLVADMSKGQWDGDEYVVVTPLARKGKRWRTMINVQGIQWPPDPANDPVLKTILAVAGWSLKVEKSSDSEMVLRINFGETLRVKGSGGAPSSGGGGEAGGTLEAGPASSAPAGSSNPTSARGAGIGSVQYVGGMEYDYTLDAAAQALGGADGADAQNSTLDPTAFQGAEVFLGAPPPMVMTPPAAGVLPAAVCP